MISFQLHQIANELGVAERINQKAKEYLEKFGEDAQLNQTQEELAELIVAINHYRRKRISRRALSKEVADVTFMLAQINIIIGDKIVSDELHKLAGDGDK